MSAIINSMDNIRLLDELARKKTFLHLIHPLVKLLTTVFYLTVITSFGRHEISGLLPFVFYPVLVVAFAELPTASIIKRILLVEPIIIGIGILNPLFDQQTVLLGELAISRGWVTFLSIFIKGGLTVSASILLIATTGMDKVGVALRMLKIPKIFVLQLLLTYRYISVLIEEVYRMMNAYALRAPGQKGISPGVWGSFAGQLLLRTYDRAQRVYEAMNLRGFTGEYQPGDVAKASIKDFGYMIAWCLFFVIARIYNLPLLIGSLFTGVIK